MDTQYASAPIVKIKVLGIGGAGNNSINRMIEEVEKGLDLPGVDFVAMNTDKAVLNINKAPIKLCIGEKLTRGFGAGSNPDVGQRAAEESAEEIRNLLEGSDIVFLTAGMGGGTGTGAAPVIASIARELGILTVAVVTKPFDFEGGHRILNADIGINNLSKFVDSTLVVPNQKLIEKLPKTGMREAFRIADEVLRQGVLGVAELIVTPMMINPDFADISMVLRGAGLTHMGIGRAKGEDRLLQAIRQAVASPLLETSINGATRIIMCIKGGEDLDLHEVSNCGTLVRDVVDPGCNIIFGADIVPDMEDEVQIMIIAAGFPKQGGLQQEQTAIMSNGLDPFTGKADEQALEHTEKEETDPNENLPPYLKKMLQQNAKNKI
ncbi:MAG: cell division protein FtsZ [Christensenellaceae bacterium]|jgi:cell division protein FtsZ|nr:cell division protein FtsZ [Christensenellaceae bacterium]